MTVILQGVVGSTAYGLAREGSDEDRLGVFVAPTVALAGLHWSPRWNTRVSHKPDPHDVTEHEVGKFLRLALDMNPTITELLWLPDAAFEVQEGSGMTLRMCRRLFLSEPAVRSAYGGYASDQATKLRRRGDSFSSDTRKRTVKHGRHLLRLLRQGRQLLETGELTVHVGDPTDYFAFDHMSTEAMLAVYETESAAFDAARSVLPAKPDRGAIESLLRWFRTTHLT